MELRILRESSMAAKRKYSGLIAINIAVLVSIVFLQIIFYGSVPAIGYDSHFKNKPEKEAACNEMTKTYNKALIPEILIGGIILLAVNFFILKKSDHNSETVVTLLFSIEACLLLGWSGSGRWRGRMS